MHEKSINTNLICVINNVQIFASAKIEHSSGEYQGKLRLMWLAQRPQTQHLEIKNTAKVPLYSNLLFSY